jgi:polysaccharide deacetylase family protein (PEP-CTERM system associated)
MPNAPECSTSDQTALSVDVEDWFHAENLQGVVGCAKWARCELRVERNTMRILEILDAGNTRATFFVLGWVAERCPQLVRAISAQGHEVASHGYGHSLVYSQRPSEFFTDVLRSKSFLEDLTGKPVYGYRAPSFSITEWAIEILQELGFRYDSSYFPTIAHNRYGKLNGMGVDTPIAAVGQGFYEISISCVRLGQRGLPWGGGGYFRLLPFQIWCGGIRAILRAGRPYIFYIHPWEIDPGQPRLRELGATYQFRHRVNLHRCEKRFAALVAAFEWKPLCDLINSGEVSR